MTYAHLIQEVEHAQRRIYPEVFITPFIKSKFLSQEGSHNVFLKLENEQRTGSFKMRGALNKVRYLQAKNTPQFPITASSGNHALGISEALKITGKQGKIVIPRNTDDAKKEALKFYPVDVEIFGRDCSESETYAREQAENGKWTYFSPYNDPQIIGGQGTIALELIQQWETVPKYVFVTVGGGGLISGIGSILKVQYPDVVLIGCQPEASPEMALSVRQNIYTTVPVRETLSDGSAGAFEEGSMTYDLCKALVDSWVLVSEDEIATAMRHVFKYERKLIEGSAGVAVAAYLKIQEDLGEGDVAIILCGGNISEEKLRKVFCS